MQRGRRRTAIFQMNSLTDTAMIEKLYEASRAGVSIDLIVRGILLPEAGEERDQREHPGDQHCRTVPGAQPRLLISQRRGARGLLRSADSQWGGTWTTGSSLSSRWRTGA